MSARVLIVAGSDSGGGAGIQADIKTVEALGGYAATAITALTAQNTLTVDDIFPVPAEFVARQMQVVLEDIGAKAIKTGMLGSAPVIDAVCDILDAARFSAIPVVVDPVMVSKSGHTLLDSGSIATLKRRLLIHADVLTPNLPEAEVLTGMDIRDLDDMRHAADMMRTLGATAVLLKGGHMDGAVVRDLLVTEDGEHLFESPRIDSRNTHGTGCTLASAVAAGMAAGLPVAEAVARARAYVAEAIRTAPGIGSGHGPLNHHHTIRPFPAPDA